MQTLSDAISVLEELEQSDARAIVGAATDVLLSLGPDGVIREASFASDEMRRVLDNRLVDRRWEDTVVEDSQAGVRDLLKVTTADGPRVRNVVHLLKDGTQLPVRYTAVMLGGNTAIVGLGRDQRAVAALQQQVLDAQMALEKDYWALRHVETRYQLLFQTATDPLLVVDAGSRRVVEANSLAEAVLGGKKALVGKVFPAGLDDTATRLLEELMTEAGTVGRASADGVKPEAGGEGFSVSVFLLRQADESRYLVRLSRSADDAAAGTGMHAYTDSVIRQAPDAIVLTDNEGRIQVANQSFLQLVQLVSGEQVVGRSIDRWLGRSNVDLSVLLNNLRQHDAVRLFATKLRGEFGTEIDVEISVANHRSDDDQQLAFFIRDVGRRIGGDSQMSGLPKSVDQITQQVGRVPLKDLVRQSTDLVEKLCIEKALELTGDNKASAAELLGVSRQGLYVKLNRHNLVDGDADE